MPRFSLSLLALVIALPAAAAPSEPTVYLCGTERIAVRFENDTARLRLGAEEMTLSLTPAASGARYEGVGAAGAVVFWERGGLATVSVDGRRLPECRRIADAAPLRLRAQGNEPFWAVEVTGERLRLMRPGTEEAEMPVVAVDAAEGELRFLGERDGATVALTLSPGPCRDTMADQVWPERARLAIAGAVVGEGCAGTAEGRLLGPAWRIEAIAGEAAMGRRPVTIEFRPGGRVGGQGPCNRFMGPWRMEEGALRFGPLAATMMMCEDPAMRQEQALHEVLGGALRHRFGEDGALVIEASEGRVITARR
ncbi:META domain-containing protein [Elioraea thermophila]|uniref:META domain-containing protein n=1 Tax=Elioraea thermophila TaxID=2185104 RepID=UPI0018E57E36|nr:META domain-containing protein [Elioraea thermophila]